MASATYTAGSKVVALTGGTGAYGAILRSGLVMDLEFGKDKFPEQVSVYAQSTIVVVVNAHAQLR
jgi:hypothetical protein